MSVVEEVIPLCVVKIQVKTLETVCDRNGMPGARFVVTKGAKFRSNNASVQLMQCCIVDVSSGRRADVNHLEPVNARRNYTV